MKNKRIILTLLVGIIALGSIGVTFSLAWFATSNRLQVNLMTIEIEGDASIRISTQLTDFEHATDHLSRSDLKPTTMFAPVTTAHKAAWEETKREKPIFYDDTLGNVDLDLRSIETGFFNQDLYLYSDKDVYVTINPNATRIVPSDNLGYAQETYNRAQASDKPEDEWLKKLTVEEIKDRLDELTKAMRFAVLNPDHENYKFVIIDPNKDQDHYLGGLLDNDIDRYYDSTYIDGVKKEELFGEYNDGSLIVYDEALKEDSDYENPEREPNSFNAKHQAGVQRVNIEKSIENGLVISKENSYSLDDFSNRPFAPLLIPVYAGSATKINVSLYIEGWDERSVNYTMGSTFNSNLQFIIARRID